jgi:hypothetical protein
MRRLFERIYESKYVIKVGAPLAEIETGVLPNIQGRLFTSVQNHSVSHTY